MAKQPTKQYILFKGNDELFTGTATEIADYQNVTPQKVRYLATPAYKEVVAKSGLPETRYIVVPLEDTAEIDRRRKQSV